jgi:hypothetical protein
MSTISYMIFVDQKNRQYAINSEDRLTFATDPVDKQYQGYGVDSNGQVLKNEPVTVLKSQLDPAGCIVTEPAS